jgi:hypothetical protein
VRQAEVYQYMINTSIAFFKKTIIIVKKTINPYFIMPTSSKIYNISTAIWLNCVFLHIVKNKNLSKASLEDMKTIVNK